jgi:hypothetical protein
MSTRPRCREALTVLLTADSSRSATELRRAQAHAAICPDCSSVVEGDRDAGQRAPTSQQLLLPQTRLARWLLMVASTLQLIVAVPWLFGSSALGFMGHATSEHLARDGALGVIVACAGAAVAARPRLSAPMLYVCLAAVVVQVLAGFVDQHDNHVAGDFEFTHVLLVAIVGLIAYILSRHRLNLRRRLPSRLSVVPGAAGR